FFLNALKLIAAPAAPTLALQPATLAASVLVPVVPAPSTPATTEAALPATQTPPSTAAVTPSVTNVSAPATPSAVPAIALIAPPPETGRHGQPAKKGSFTTRTIKS